MKNTKKIILTMLFVIIIVSTFVVNAFALPPEDLEENSPYEPDFMYDIVPVPSGAYDGFEYASWGYSRVEFGHKPSIGLAVVSYNVSAYTNQNVNIISPYFIYFDYFKEDYSASGPRTYVWMGQGTVEYDGVNYGTASARGGFGINIVNNQLKVGVMYGGNYIQPSIKSINLDNAITYIDARQGENTTYSFRIKVTKESDIVALQLLTDEYFVTVATFKYDVNANYSSLAFGVYDSISANNLVSYNYIRYESYNEVYEQALQLGISMGYDGGERDGIAIGKEIGFGEGYDEGYKDGKLDGSSSEIAVPDVIDSVIQAPVTIFQNIFGFELFGINIAVLIGSIFLVVVLAWIIRKLVR